MATEDDKKVMDGVLTQLDTDISNFDRMNLKKVVEMIAKDDEAMEYLEPERQLKLLASVCVLLMSETTQLRLKLGQLERRPPPLMNARIG